MKITWYHERRPDGNVLRIEKRTRRGRVVLVQVKPDDFKTKEDMLKEIGRQAPSRVMVARNKEG
jgi:hypothetical protein